MVQQYEQYDNSRTRVLASQGRSREEREERVVVIVWD